MITDLCVKCWLYHAPGVDCKEALAQGQAWLVKPPVDGWPTPEPMPQPKRRGRKPNATRSA